MTTPFSNTRLLVVGAHTTATQFLLKRLPAPGDYLVADGYRVAADGGKGSNQAVAAARLGARVTLVSAVGDDDPGHAALEYLGGQGIDLRHVVVTPDLPTGVGAGFYAADGTLVGATFLGANAAITAPYLDDHRALFDEAFDAMLVSLELPVDGVLRALALGRAAGIRQIVVNPAPADAVPRAVLPAVDVLTPNEPEARLLAGFGSSTNEPIERVAAEVAAALGAPIVVVTRGKDGCFLSGAGPGRQLACPRVEAVDVSGAGDCFSACLTAALGTNWPIDEAVTLALRAASLSVTRRDTWTAFPTYDEVRAWSGS
jgi:ribokinase